MPYKNFKKTEIIDELGMELRKVRNARELTLFQVAEALEATGTHVSNIMLGRIETGQRRIDDDLFLALCSHYDTDPNELTIRACQAHVKNLQDESGIGQSGESEMSWIVETYHNLPENRKADVRTMLRMLSYMDKFSKLE